MRKKRKSLKFFILGFIAIISISMSYALFSSSINIKGRVSGTNDNNIIVDKDSNPNLSMGSIKQNHWMEKNQYRHQIQFPITNNSQEVIDNYKLIITFDTEVLFVSIWNFEYEIKGKNLIIKSNNHLNPNQVIDANFIVGVSKENLKITKIKFEVDTDVEEVDPSLIEIDFVIANGWGNYTYQYNVTIKNKTDKQITYWQINIDLPNGTSYGSGWNGIFNSNNNQLVIKNASYNGKLSPNQSTSFGLQLNTNIVNFIPKNYKVVVR